MKRFVRTIAPARRAVGVFHCAPGAEAQVDVFRGAPTLDAGTGEWRRPWVFRMTLGHSRHVCPRTQPDPPPMGASSVEYTGAAVVASVASLQILLAALAGWLSGRQQDVIGYLVEESRLCPVARPTVATHG